jgi:23S rRNA G2445 N2-methylase RlmL
MRRRPAVGTRLFARTVHGLEHVAARELRERGGTVVTVSPRHLVVLAPLSLLDRPPATVDDLFPLALSTPDPGPTKADLAVLAGTVAAAPISVDPRGDRFSVSASAAGRRTYSRYDIEDAVGGALASRFAAAYVSRRDGRRPPPGTVDWRVTVDAGGVHIGLRGTRPPLHRRPWKVASVPGTLHPPVAAAMVRLAGVRPGDVVVDPCCGAGTLLAEAPTHARAGSDIAGVAAAMANAPAVAWFTSDARRLPYPAGSVDHVVTNPPWDRQVAAHGTFAELVAEWRRILRPGGRLTYLGPWAPPPGWRVVTRQPISLFGQHPTITVCER